MMLPVMYKYIGIALAIMALCGYCFHKGYQIEHDKFLTFQAEVVQKAKDQNEASALKDKQTKENEDNAKLAAADAMQGISDYYRAHPVVRMHNPNSCVSQLPSTTGNTQSADGSAPDGYFSPYSPELTETIASQLYELQELLTKDGVKIE